MRRSAGFALAFLSILKAEPPNMPVTLLPVVMQRLLSHAFNGDVPTVYAKALGNPEPTPGGVSERCRVHALNILKLLFHDSSMVKSMEAYVAPALQASIVGFQATSWGVRNSSMMVFAVVTTRWVVDVGGCG